MYHQILNSAAAAAQAPACPICLHGVCHYKIHNYADVIFPTPIERARVWEGVQEGEKDSCPFVCDIFISVAFFTDTDFETEAKTLV